MDADPTPRTDPDPVVAASTIGLGIVIRTLAPALEQVTLQQYRVLVLLVTRGPMRAGDLATELGLLPSGTTRIVDRLVRDGFVEKHVSRTSGREVTVTALERSQALVAHVLDRRQAEFLAVLRRMSSEERTAVRRAAEAIVRVADTGPLLDAELLLATGAGR